MDKSPHLGSDWDAMSPVSEPHFSALGLPHLPPTGSAAVAALRTPLRTQPPTPCALPRLLILPPRSQRFSSLDPSSDPGQTLLPL